MGKVVKNKRIISILVTLMMVLSLSFSAFAESESQAVFVEYFEVRASGSYADIGDCMIIYDYPSNNGIIYLQSSIRVTKDKKTFTIPAGTVWDYQISSYKDGGKIALKFNNQLSSSSSAYSICKKYGLLTMTGKIHIDRSKARWNFGNRSSFWKIDCLGCGFYFRNS